MLRWMTVFFFCKKVSSIMIFFHGTTSKNVDSILRNGLRFPCLTDRKSLAEYYADAASEDEGGDPVILSIAMRGDALLQYDACAMDEPVGFDGLSCAELETRVAERWSIGGAGNPEWVNNGIIAIPENQWRVSLETVASVRYNGTVGAECITAL